MKNFSTKYRISRAKILKNNSKFRIFCPKTVRNKLTD